MSILGVPIEERFWSKVDFGGPCWQWTAAVTTDGYGIFRITPTRLLRAHRFAWQTLCGPLVPGLVLDHLCKNTLCVNPDHLDEVTPRENAQRSYAGAYLKARTECPKGHPYDEANTVYNRRGYRQCRRCHVLSGRARRARQRDALVGGAA